MPDPRRLTLPPELLRRARARVADHAGLRPPDWVLEARVVDRLHALGERNASAYIELIDSHQGKNELQLLVEALRVGETRFFRHRSHVRALLDVVVPALAGCASKRIRVWSAGCATGEEPYTLAMLLTREIPTARIDILASDISRDALAVARRGEYSREALAHVPDDLAAEFFEPIAGDRVRIAETVARRVTFEQRNLAEDDYPSGFDLIWCRNVLIYFTPDARIRAVGHLVDSLIEGGFLFVGYAESLRDFDAVDAVRTPDAVLYRKASALATEMVERPRSSPVRPKPHSPSPPWAEPSPPPPTPSPRVVAEDAVIALYGNYGEDDIERLSSELADAIAGDYRRVTVDLDGVELFADEAARVLRRARAAASAAGVALSYVTTRSGTMRWLRRVGLEDA